MEHSILIACAMQEDEVRKWQRLCNYTGSIVFLKRGLHENPKQLKDMLTKEIDANQDADTIMLTYGLCGGAADGLCSRNTKLVLPRFHDCIHQLTKNQVEKKTLYVTRAWTLDEASVTGQCKKILHEYGVEQGSEILKSIYGNYEKIEILDTDSYELTSVLPRLEKTAGLLSMQLSVKKTDCSVIRKLLLGKWDADFILCAPGETIRRSMFFE